MIYDKLVGFSGFGFPKSHAAAFALLAYQSAWLRHYFPGEFLCALMNAQPMGFYPPSSLVRDAQRRGIEVRPPHVNRSAAKCAIEDGTVRIGLGYIRSVGADEAEAVVAAQPYADAADLARRAPVAADALEAIVASGACDDWGPRRELLWRLGATPRPESAGGGSRQLVLPIGPTAETPELPAQTDWERMLADYRHTSVSVGVHPLELLRPHLDGVVSSAELRDVPHGAQIAVAGMAVARQRPSTAKGIVFMLLEDEHGQLNLIVPPQVYEEHRAIVRGEPLILARGRFERVGRNENVLVESVETLGPLARRVANEAEVHAALRRRTTSATADRGRMRRVTRFLASALALVSLASSRRADPAAARRGEGAAHPRERLAAELPGAALAPAPADRALLGLRRPRAQGAARRARGRRRAAAACLLTAARDALPDPAHASSATCTGGARRRPTATSAASFECRQAVPSPCSGGSGDGHLVEPRVRARDRPEPGREPVRRLRDDAQPEGPLVPRPLAAPARDGRRRRSSRRSRRSAGAGAARGAARRRTTCTSRTTATDGLPAGATLRRMVLFPLAVIWLIVIFVWVLRNSRNAPPEERVWRRWRPSPRKPRDGGDRAGRAPAPAASRPRR